MVGEAGCMASRAAVPPYLLHAHARCRCSHAGAQEQASRRRSGQVPGARLSAGAAKGERVTSGSGPTLLLSFASARHLGAARSRCSRTWLHSFIFLPHRTVQPHNALRFPEG